MPGGACTAAKQRAPCKRGHVAGRHPNGACVQCHKLQARAYQQAIAGYGAVELTPEQVQRRDRINLRARKRRSKA